MGNNLTRTLQKIEHAGMDPISGAVRRGLEKESLRIDAAGVISQQTHPEALGAALSHRYITTDYSEALLEFITPIFDKSLTRCMILRPGSPFRILVAAAPNFASRDSISSPE